MAACANCNKAFSKKGDKGYFRFPLENSLHGDQSAKDLLTDVTGATFTPVSSKRLGQFVCPESQTVSLQKKGVAKNLFSKKASRSTKWDSIISAVKARQYGRAIRGMYTATKGSKKSFTNIVVNLVRREVLTLLGQKLFPLFQDVNIVNLEQFSWTRTLHDFEKACLLLFNVLRGAITKRANENSLIRGKSVNLRPQIGTSIACILNARAPKTASFLPSLFSVQFWRGGLKRNVMKQLAHTGICKGYDTTLSILDKIRQGFDSAATTCKTIIEEQHQQQNVKRINVTNEDADLSLAIAAVVPNIEDEVNNLSASSQDTVIINMDDTIPYGMDDTDDDDVLDDSLSDHSNSDGIHLSSDDEDDISDGEEQRVIPHESDEEKEENPQIDLHPGFSMCWDNVGKK
ncbi:unnamed protein product [Mytilus coruscus]|uniref:Uncharacterized protein n=1 Tax=Mytilus coruscus TaxID=42192 RepID=A0A6J8BQX1_MYTCO|nr:unnamed protein product [Mytilus coruscus]